MSGRYLFPVLIPLFGFTARALASDAPRRLRLPLAVAVGGLFRYGDLPTLLLRTTPHWFGVPTP